MNQPETSSEASRIVSMLDAGRVSDARAASDRLLATRRDGVSLHLAGVVAAREQRMDAARTLLAEAAGRRLDDAEVHCNLGAAHRAHGDFDAAIACFERALALDPTHARACFNLSQVRDGDHGPLPETIRRALETGEPSRADRACLHFAAGKIGDDLGRHAEAFYHFQLGNAARPAAFDPAAHRRMVDRVIEVFDAARLARLGADGHPSETPVFIVGMPRSGTTLLEQILASHPDVHAAGELPDVRAIAGTLPRHAGDAPYPECVDEVPGEAFRGFAGSYLKRLAALDPADPPGHCRVVDKNPGNALHLGLLALMLPRAGVIHCRRDPVETCASCYFQMFADGHDYAFDLGHLGFYYRQHERLMDHWRKVLSAPPHEVVYEELVADPEPVIRGVLDHCGLAWDDRCLRPDQTPRPIMTASARQVRDPIDPTRAGRYAAYADWLGPLRNALELAG